MGEASASASAVRLQQCLDDFVRASAGSEALVGSVGTARELLQSLEEAGVIDKPKPRGRPVLRVSSKEFTRVRKRCNYLVRKSNRLLKEVKSYKSAKKHGQIERCWQRA